MLESVRKVWSWPEVGKLWNLGEGKFNFRCYEVSFTSPVLDGWRLGGQK